MIYTFTKCFTVTGMLAALGIYSTNINTNWFVFLLSTVPPPFTVGYTVYEYVRRTVAKRTLHPNLAAFATNFPGL